MNRIILIGNGFDLAHNLETGFNDFINFYWSGLIEKIKKEPIHTKFNNEDIIITKTPKKWLPGDNHLSLRETLYENRTRIIYKNKLLEAITIKSESSWVDIENEYYNLLLKSFKEDKTNYAIERLNLDFTRIKSSLCNYLTEVESDFKITSKNIKNEIGNHIYSPFRLTDFTESSINSKVQDEYNKIKKLLEAHRDGMQIHEFDENDAKLISKFSLDSRLYDEVRKTLLKPSAINWFKLDPTKILILNFNYTKTDQYYSKINPDYNFGLESNAQVNTIRIHGSLTKNEYNPIIFGFGDELDDDYKNLEKLNDNRYLEHIKSIGYLETDNYKRLLEFINKSQYQIFLFGHSCGTSDRTLLNTLFENENCVSIKPFFHKREDGSDNYTDLIMNITRNFNDKAILRDKVVNKRFCQPLIS